MSAKLFSSGDMNPEFYHLYFESMTRLYPGVSSKYLHNALNTLMRSTVPFVEKLAHLNKVLRSMVELNRDASFLLTDTSMLSWISSSSHNLLSSLIDYYKTPMPKAMNTHRDNIKAFRIELIKTLAKLLDDTDLNDYPFDHTKLQKLRLFLIKNHKTSDSKLALSFFLTIATLMAKKKAGPELVQILQEKMPTMSLQGDNELAKLLTEFARLDGRHNGRIGKVVFGDLESHNKSIYNQLFKSINSNYCRTSLTKLYIVY